MTSKTGKTSLKYKTDLKPQSFAVVMAGTSAQIAGLLYVWKEYTSFGETIEKCGTDAKCYMNTEDPWSRQVVITAGIITVTWILSLILGFGGFGHGTPGTADPSIVDRLWSILPPLYVWGCYFSTKTSTGEPSLRLLAMAVLSTIWSCRLTYNFAIKGGFSGGEDYRWEHLRRWFPGLQWEAFNLVFICTLYSSANVREYHSYHSLENHTRTQDYEIWIISLEETTKSFSNTILDHHTLTLE